MSIAPVPAAISAAASGTPNSKIQSIESPGPAMKPSIEIDRLTTTLPLAVPVLLMRRCSYETSFRVQYRCTCGGSAGRAERLIGGSSPSSASTSHHRRRRVRARPLGPSVAAMSHESDGRPGGGFDAADGPVLDARFLEVAVERLDRVARDGGEEAARSLRVVSQRHELWSDAGRDSERWRHEASVVGCAAGLDPRPRQVERAVKSGQRRRVEDE